MNTLWRILQLTASAIVFIIVSTSAFFVIELLSKGRLEKWRSDPFSGAVSDECIAVELATVPIVLGVFASWGVVRLFRMRAINNEIADTFRPVLELITGYSRFLLIVISVIYLVIGSFWAALVHLVLAVIAFVYFYRTHDAELRATIRRNLERTVNEEDDHSEHVE